MGLTTPRGATQYVCLRNGTAGTLIIVGINVGTQLTNEHGHELCVMAIGRGRGDDVEVDAVVGG